MRREEYYVGKRLMVIDVLGKRTKAIPKRRRLDSIDHDLTEKMYTNLSKYYFQQFI